MKTVCLKREADWPEKYYLKDLCDLRMDLY